MGQWGPYKIHRLNIESLIVGSRHDTEKKYHFWSQVNFFEERVLIEAVIISLSFINESTKNPGIGLKWQIRIKIYKLSIIWDQIKGFSSIL